MVSQGRAGGLLAFFSPENSCQQHSLNGYVFCKYVLILLLSLSSFALAIFVLRGSTKTSLQLNPDVLCVMRVPPAVF